LRRERVSGEPHDASSLAALAKGSHLVDLVKWARAQRSAFEPFLPPETRAFLDTRILVGSWYPEIHLSHLLAATDQVHGKGNLAFCWNLGRMSAKNQLQGTYRTTVAAGDPLRTLSLLPTLWPLHHNTGSLSLHTVAKQHVRFVLTGFGYPNRPHCVSLCGWFEGAVIEAGGQAHVVEEGCRVSGNEACIYGIRWTMTTDGGV
jgi:hypothetical protein